MWIIRFQKIKTKDYNFVKNIFRKMWFFPKNTKEIAFIKAIFFHLLQWKSWRAIWKLLWIENHLIFYKFYVKYKNNPDFEKIFHHFSDSKVIVFIGEKKTFSNDDLDNSLEFELLTKNEIKNIINKVNL